MEQEAASLNRSRETARHPMRCYWRSFDLCNHRLNYFWTASIGSRMGTSGNLVRQTRCHPHACKPI